MVLQSVNGVPVDTRFFFPQSCSDSTRECCPTGIDGAVCSGATRGLCRTAFEGDFSFCDNAREDAISWATHFFDKFCICEGNYWGVACEQCAPGWTGDDCTIPKTLTIRRNIQHLNDSERATVVHAFELMRTMPHPFWPEISVWAWVTSLHSWAKSPISDTGDYSTKQMDFAHRGPSLAVWHRIYQWHLERYMQIALGDDTFTIPYWDWSNSTIAGTADDIALQLIGGDGDPDSLLADGVYCHEQPTPLTYPYCNCTVINGPFAGWPAYDYWGNVTWAEAIGDVPIQRAFNCSTAGGLPDSGNIETLLLMSDYEDMYPQLEGKHGRIHSYIGWTMYRGSPPSDPIFWLHHSFIDLILERWLRRTATLGLLSMQNIQPVNTSAIGHGRDECAVPHYPLVRNYDWMKPSWSLGYTFDYFQVADADGDIQEPLVTTPYIMLDDPAVPTIGVEVRHAAQVLKEIAREKYDDPTPMSMVATPTTATTPAAIAKAAATTATPVVDVGVVTTNELLTDNGDCNKKSSTSSKKKKSVHTTKASSSPSPTSSSHVSRKLHAISSLGRLRASMLQPMNDDEPVFDTQEQQREDDAARAALSFVHQPQPHAHGIPLQPVHDAHPPLPSDQNTKVTIAEAVTSIASEYSGTTEYSGTEYSGTTSNSYVGPSHNSDNGYTPKYIATTTTMAMTNDIGMESQQQPGQADDDTEDVHMTHGADRKSRVHNAPGVSAEDAALSMATEIVLTDDIAVVATEYSGIEYSGTTTTNSEYTGEYSGTTYVGPSHNSDNGYTPKYIATPTTNIAMDSQQQQPGEGNDDTEDVHITTTMLATTSEYSGTTEYSGTEYSGTEYTGSSYVGPSHNSDNGYTPKYIATNKIVVIDGQILAADAIRNDDVTDTTAAAGVTDTSISVIGEHVDVSSSRKRDEEQHAIARESIVGATHITAAASASSSLSVNEYSGSSNTDYSGATEYGSSSLSSSTNQADDLFFIATHVRATTSSSNSNSEYGYGGTSSSEYSGTTSEYTGSSATEYGSVVDRR